MTLHEATAADALARLRTEIESLAGAAAAAAIRATPLRVETSGREPNEYSTEIWYEDASFKVISRGMDASACPAEQADAGLVARLHADRHRTDSGDRLGAAVCTRMGHPTQTRLTASQSAPLRLAFWRVPNAESSWSHSQGTRQEH